MLAIFNEGVVNPPEELHSPTSLTSPRKPKLPDEICKDFVDSHPSNTFLISFKNAASLAYVPPRNPYSSSKRLFCGIDNIYCIFMGSLSNLSNLNKQYGLSKGSNEAMLVIEAYRTLRDRGPYPAHQGAIANEEVRLFWGIAGDGSLVISDDLEVIKAGCAKSFAPFPSGCMFHSKQGLMSFEHPRSQIKPMPRIDSEGVMCEANFTVDVQSRMTTTMPRVGSEANWALSGSSLV